MKQAVAQANDPHLATVRFYQQKSLSLLRGAIEP